MKKEDLTKLGLTEDQIKEVQRLNGLDLEPFKAKEQELTGQLTQANSVIEERDKQLSELKNSTGDIETLKSKITQLEADNKTAAEKYQNDLKDLKLSNAIKLAINGKVHDEEIASGLFDKSKLILNDDGKVTGLDDQLKNLKETKAFLFKEEKAQEQPKDPMTGFKFGAQNSNPSPTVNEQLNAAFGLNK